MSRSPYITRSKVDLTSNPPPSALPTNFERDIRRPEIPRPSSPLVSSIGFIQDTESQQTTPRRSLPFTSRQSSSSRRTSEPSTSLYVTSIPPKSSEVPRDILNRFILEFGRRPTVPELLEYQQKHLKTPSPERIKVESESDPDFKVVQFLIDYNIEHQTPGEFPSFDDRQKLEAAREQLKRLSRSNPFKYERILETLNQSFQSRLDWSTAETEFSFSTPCGQEFPTPSTQNNETSQEDQHQETHQQSPPRSNSNSPQRSRSPSPEDNEERNNSDDGGRNHDSENSDEGDPEEPDPPDSFELDEGSEPTMAPKDDLTADINDLTDELQRLKEELDKNKPQNQPPELLTDIQVEIINEDIERAIKSLESIRSRTHRLYTTDQVTATEGLKVKTLQDTLNPIRTAVRTLKHGFDLRAKSTTLIKREALPLPKFSGDSSAWAEFKDQFDAAYHNDVRLANSVKLQNLKNLMVPGSTPAQLISGFIITDDNYPLAYNALKSRYEKTRELASSYLHTIFNLPNLSNQNGLQAMIDTVRTTLQKIQTLGIPTNEWDPIMVYLIYEKLDTFSRRECEKSHPGNHFPALQAVLDTLEPLAVANDTSRLKSKTPSDSNEKLQPTNKKQSSKKKPEKSEGSSSESPTQRSSKSKPDREKICFICKSGEHWTSRCEQVTKLTTINQRTKFLRDKGLCEKCANDHTTADCKRKKKCPIESCADIHHPVVCPLAVKKSSTSNYSGSESQAETFSASSSSTTNSREILPTVMLELLDRDGVPQKFRGLVDSCSQINVISERAMALLRTPRQNSHTIITGTGLAKCETPKGVTTITAQSLINKLWRQELEFLIMTSVANSHPQPSAVSDADPWTHLSSIPLADPSFRQTGRIDFLLSSGVYADIKRGGLIKGNPGQPIAEETELGWIVMGQTSGSSTSPSPLSFLCECDPNFDLSLFFQQEELPSVKASPTDEEKAIETHFLNTHTRDENGRFVVELPFQTPPPVLGNSEAQARTRFKNKERSLSKSPSHQLLYEDQINQLIDLEYAFKVPPSEIFVPQNDSYYVPHHGVFKAQSSSTKLRIVMDFSMKSSSGFSLNDALLCGPIIQPELRATLTKFRTHEFVFTADIEKMYHQIKVTEKHQNFLRFFWRSHPLQPIQIFKLTRLPFGAKPSSFVAVRCFQQLAIDEGSDFPNAALRVFTDFYMDDCCSGDSVSIESTIQLAKDLQQLSARGGFHLTKFTSNDPRLVESFPPEDRSRNLPISFEDAESIKTLGIRWNPISDSFSFHVNLDPRDKYSKRDVISIIARIFDPNGLIQPVIVPAKLIIQEIWKAKLDWKDIITPEIHFVWTNFLDNLPMVKEIQIPRRLMRNGAIRYELHAFSDASKSAYGSAVYLRSEYSDGTFTSNLVASKSRITPLSSSSSLAKNPGRTIPRLELLGAAVSAQLIRIVENSLSLTISQMHLWTDSSITLWRLKNRNLKNDANVNKKIDSILELTSVEQWHYIRTKENPADILSRGMSPSLLNNSKLWWSGPDWMTSPILPIVPIPGSPQEFGMKEKAEAKTSNFASYEINPKAGTFTGLLRASAQIRRGFPFILKRLGRNPKMDSTLTGPITKLELDQAELQWIKEIQSSAFPDDTRRLSKGKPINHSSHLKRLSPQLIEGILRVGGRLSHSHLPEDFKHQIILPKCHPFTDMLIRRHHYQLLHAGPQQTRYSILEKYWILQGHAAVKKVLHRCLVCFRFSTKPSQQLMGQLPDPRVNISPIFSSTGVDYAGPLQMSLSGNRASRNRNQPISKVYIAVFICLSTKLVHLEAVTGLTSELFLAALSRFTSLWGRPDRVYSDNGTNFKGADKELRLFQEFLESTEIANQIIEKGAKEGIQWIFNPPSAPHQGGLWEAAVKSTKYHLKRIAGDRTFTYEELATLLSRIQGVLNSRPLYPLTADQTGNYPLTPSHFYLSRPVTSLPAPDFTEIPLNRLNRYQQQLQVFQHFQRRFKREYLTHLQERSKWETSSPNVEVGQFCILIDENLSASKWATGKIIDVHPGLDGLVRKVTIKTEAGIYQRPIVKIIPIPRG